MHIDDQQAVDLHVVSDGEQALDYIDAVGDGLVAEKPDLIVLDLNLPKSDGAG